ncbi:hypothetical protein HispidOSU_021764, partial [Sigmodon hispidus]
THVGILKKANQIGLTCLLQSTNDCTLEVQICFEVPSNFSNQPLEEELANQKFSEFLIASDFTECHRTRPVTRRLLHPSSRGRTLASGFYSQLFPGCFTICGFVGSLLCKSHGISTSLLTYTPSPSPGTLQALALDSGSAVAPANTIRKRHFVQKDHK